MIESPQILGKKSMEIPVIFAIQRSICHLIKDTSKEEILNFYYLGTILCGCVQVKRFAVHL